MKVQETPDSEIIARFLVEKTKNAAFSDLVLKYQKRIYWHIRRMVINHDDADDQMICIPTEEAIDEDVKEYQEELERLSKLKQL